MSFSFKRTTMHPRLLTQHGGTVNVCARSMAARVRSNISEPFVSLRVVAIVCISAFVLTGNINAQSVSLPSAGTFQDGVALVAFKAGVLGSQGAAAAAAAGAVDMETIGARTHVLHFGKGRVAQVLQALRNNPLVRYAEPDYLQWPAGVPNDVAFPLQWGFQNTGQTVQGTTGTPGADEEAISTWKVTTGAAGANGVVVAVLDTGVQYNHPDLESNMWSNPGGIGGCPAGTNGFNELNNTCNPMDDDTVYAGHGTHIAGIIGAATNNGFGISGLNWTTQIMAVKWMPSSGAGLTSKLIKAMQWVISAKQSGVNIRVVNDSGTWVGTAFSQALSDEIDQLGSNDILFVTAAGNQAKDNDMVPRYPCVYARANEICVAASDQNDQLWSSSDYGLSSVDLAAPGVNIYSTLRSTNYGYISGTSMSASQVSGAAALILSKGYQPVATLKSTILNNVDVLPSLTSFVRTGGRLNVCKAVPGCMTAVTAIPANASAPLVVGMAQFGHQMGAWTGSWTGSPTSFAYQWSRCDGSGAELRSNFRSDVLHLCVARKCRRGLQAHSHNHGFKQCRSSFRKFRARASDTGCRLIVVVSRLDNPRPVDHRRPGTVAGNTIATLGERKQCAVLYRR